MAGKVLVFWLVLGGYSLYDNSLKPYYFVSCGFLCFIFYNKKDLNKMSEILKEIPDYPLS